MEHSNVVTGAWVQVIGTVIAAIGETLEVTEDTLGSGLNGLRWVSIGNGLEGVGNAIQAIGESEIGTDTVLILGSWLQVVGNFTNSVATEIQITGEEQEGIKIDILGVSTQSIGAAFEALGAKLRGEEYDQDIFKGNSLISLGAAIEGVGQVYVLKGKTSVGLKIKTVGSYLEAAGATLAAIAQTKQYESNRIKEIVKYKKNNYYHQF